MSIVISTKCNLLLLRNNVSRPTSRMRERSTNGNSRSTGLAPGASFIWQGTSTGTLIPAQLVPTDSRFSSNPARSILGPMSIELDEKLLSSAAGWDVMKLARAYVAQGQVVSSHWAPPLLRGVVQAGDLTIRASMVIHDNIDVENLCTCRDARQWGRICA